MLDFPQGVGAGLRPAPTPCPLPTQVLLDALTTGRRWHARQVENGVVHDLADLSPRPISVRSEVQPWAWLSGIATGVAAYHLVTIPGLYVAVEGIRVRHVVECRGGRIDQFPSRRQRSNLA